MRIDPLFDKLLRKLTPDDVAVDQGLQRAKRVAGVLANDPNLGVHMTQIGGSCAKETAVHPVKDVDLFVYLDKAAWRRKGDNATYAPHTVLRRFYERLQRTFRKPIGDGDVALRLQDHSIRVRYLKEGSVAIDVVPALWADRNKAEIVKIPERSSREWRETCIARQILLLDRYDATNRYLRRGIRLLKHWRNQHRLPLPSYALELLAIHAAPKVDSKHPRAVFMQVQERIAATSLQEPTRMTHYVPAADNKVPRGAEMVILDAAVAGKNVASEIGAGERRAVVAAARHSLERLKAAEHHMMHGHVRDAGVAFRAAFARKRRPTRQNAAADAQTGAAPQPSPQPVAKRGFLAWLLG
jgi:hypothetical protein